MLSMTKKILKPKCVFDLQIVDADDKRLLEDDKKFFFVADQDKDGKLSNTEFHAFQNPESFPHMHGALIEVTLQTFRNFFPKFRMQNNI